MLIYYLFCKRTVPTLSLDINVLVGQMWTDSYTFIVFSKDLVHI